MADIRRHTLSTSYLGGEQDFPAGSERVEFWGVDADPWTADAEIIVRLTDQQGTTSERRVQAGQTYLLEAKRGSIDSWTYNVKAAAGTPDASVVLL